MADLSQVFISYSHDSEEHRRRVLSLADRLGEREIIIALDQNCESPLEGWPQWSATQVRQSSFVIMVCTETYCRRVTGQEKPGEGRGATWEGRLIYQKIYDSDSKNEKLIPVLFQDGDPAHIPDILRGSTCYNVDLEQDFEKLCRRLGGRSNDALGARSDVPRFHAIGRDDEIQKVLDLLSEGKNVWVHGMGGLGKSVLASAVAYHPEAISRWPHARVFIDLRNAPRRRSRVLSTFAMRTAIKRFEPQARPETPQVGETFKRNVEGKACLFVIDNVDSAQQVDEFLRNMGSSSRALITSRIIMSSDLVHTYDLQVLKPRDIRALLIDAMDEVDASDKQLREIIELCGSLPLAVSIAGKFLATHGDYHPRDFIRRLRQERLELLSKIGNKAGVDVQAVLRIGLENLSPERAARWRSLAVFPSMFDERAAQFVWQMDRREDVIDELSEFRASSLLLHDRNRARYFLHELMSDVARAELKQNLRELSIAYENFSRHFCDVLRKSNEEFLRGQVQSSTSLSVFGREGGGTSEPDMCGRKRMLRETTPLANSVSTTPSREPTFSDCVSRLRNACAGWTSLSKLFRATSSATALLNLDYWMNSAQLIVRPAIPGAPSTIIDEQSTWRNRSRALR
jgi:SEFIR domain-containing protein/NB-ARC domain-containing protein